ncbi:thioredoxin family protein [Echinicola sp. CAU 1574]|uniref:Thioredoxin family protein n=1 Tax=Echinicola arenosa TaxID=2774144 RepID=A0ABR9AJX7_9BACT|nr:thioredoxin domain-containing protein [Echinicola arenosa]MBD8489061.1 thioredoxin family protein [Echinicola arenosa]
MNIKQNLLLTLSFVIAAATTVNAQGIEFNKGTYTEALAEANERGVPLFIDFYADWCGPCKMMDKQVFVDQELGTYFNENFVSVKLNTEHEINEELVKELDITSMPTLMFVDGEGEVISRISGSMNIEEMLKLGKTVTGDLKSFEEMYTAYKKDKNNFEVMQELLKAAPSFVSFQTGMDKKKWIIRIENIFEEYIEKKMAMGDAFINADDYRLVNRFYEPKGEHDEVIEFMVANMDKYIENVGNAPAFYVIRNNTTMAQDLAKKGDKKYMEILERIKGDMKPAYDIAEEGHNISQYEIAKLDCDALYALYEEKDADKYIQLKNEYFEADGDKVTSLSKASAAQAMYYAMGNDVSEKNNAAAKEWIIASLAGDKIPLMQRINIIALLGDVNKHMGLLKEAEQAYNRAYAETLQMEESRSQMYLQLQLKRKIEMLNLE